MSADDVRDELERAPRRDAPTEELDVLAAPPDELDVMLRNARTALVRANALVLLRFWPPGQSFSGQWEATWKSPSGRLNKAAYPGQVRMIDDALERFGLPS
jgi:hypothetical protein